MIKLFLLILKKLIHRLQVLNELPFLAHVPLSLSVAFCVWSRLPMHFLWLRSMLFALRVVAVALMVMRYAVLMMVARSSSTLTLIYQRTWTQFLLILVFATFIVILVMPAIMLAQIEFWLTLGCLLGSLCRLVFISLTRLIQLMLVVLILVRMLLVLRPIVRLEFMQNVFIWGLEIASGNLIFIFQNKLLSARLTAL